MLKTDELTVSLRQAMEVSEHTWSSNLPPLFREALECQSDDCGTLVTPDLLRALADVLRFAATDLANRHPE